MNKVAALLVLAVIVVGCEPAPADSGQVPATTDTPVSVALNQTLLVDTIQITPAHVIGDSRCPSPASCVWSGQVVLDVTVNDGDGNRSIRVSTLDKNLNQPHVADLHITIQSVTPGQRLNGTQQVTIAPEDYRFTLVFSRVPQPMGRLGAVQPGQLVRMKAGETASYPGTLRVRFDRIVKNERCPKSSTIACATAGQASIAVTVENNGASEAGELRIPGLTDDATAFPNLPARPGATARLAGVDVRFVSLEPQFTSLQDPAIGTSLSATLLVTMP